MSVEVTIDDVLDAIEKNGLEQAYGTYFQYSKVDTGTEFQSNIPYTGEYKVQAACAIGQAAINLGADNNELTTALNAINNLGQRIIKMNDIRHKSFAEIAKYYRRRLTKAQRNSKIKLYKGFEYNV